MPDIDEVTAIDPDALWDEDPLLSKMEMPFESILFPLGFPLKLSTNSPAVLKAADASWGHCKQKFEYPPLEFRLGVTTGDDHNSGPPPIPTMRMHWGLFLRIADARNFVAVDLKAGRAFGWITQATAECHPYLRYYLLGSSVQSLIIAVRAAFLHAACVCPFGHGMLLCGDCGAGKSTLSYAGARAGWTFVSDDGSYLVLNRTDRLVVGDSRYAHLRGAASIFFPELVEQPIIPHGAGKPSIEVPMAKTSGIVTADSAIVEYLIFLNRHWTGAPELAPLSLQSVPRWLERSLILTAENSQTVKDDVLRRLLDAQVFELRYQDLDWAIDRLNTLALTGR